MLIKNFLCINTIFKPYITHSGYICLHVFSNLTNNHIESGVVFLNPQAPKTTNGLSLAIDLRNRNHVRIATNLSFIVLYRAFD